MCELRQCHSDDLRLLVNYYYTGGLIGTLPDLARHRISGNFYIVDSRTIFIEDFNYDGTAPGLHQSN